MIKHTPSCETCSGKGYIHTTRHPDDREYVERCDECYQEGRVSWTDEQAAEYVRRLELKQSLIGMLDELCTFRSVECWKADDVEDMITKIDTLLP